jgi:predicted DNA-binding antitoxin AbrB/MazE fold protein
MSQVITATFEDGVLKPDEKLDLPSGTKVKLIVLEPPTVPSEAERQAAWEELERLWQETTINSGGDLLTRDELHDR